MAAFEFPNKLAGAFADFSFSPFSRGEGGRSPDMGQRQTMTFDQSPRTVHRWTMEMLRSPIFNYLTTSANDPKRLFGPSGWLVAY